MLHTHATHPCLLHTHAYYTPMPHEWQVTRPLLHTHAYYSVGNCICLICHTACLNITVSNHRYSQAFWNGFSNWRHTSVYPDHEYALWFRGTATRALAAMTSLNVHVFAPNCVVHTFADNPLWGQASVRGWTSRDVVGELVYRNSSRYPRILIDDCSGLSCSEGCPSV